MTSKTLPSLAPARRVVLPLGLGTAISLLGDGTLYTVLPNPEIAAQAGVTLAMVGLLLGINRVTRLVTNGLLGVLYDRLPRRGLLTAAMGVGALSTAVFALGVGPPPLIVSRVLWGVAWSGIWIGGNTVVLDISGDHDRGRLSGRYQMWFFLGAAGSALAGGVLTDALGFRRGLAVSAGLTGLMALVWLLAMPETRPADASPRQKARNAPAGPFPWRVALATSAPLFATRFVVAGVLAATTILWLSEFLGEGLSLPGFTLPLASLTGGFVAARMLTSIVGAPAMGALSDRLGRRWMVLAASLALAAGGLWLMGGEALVPALAGGLFAAVTGGSVQALAPAIAGDQVGQDQQGRVLSVMFTLGDLGSALGPPLALGLLPLLSLGTIYRACAAFFGMMALFALWHSRAERVPSAAHA